MALVYEGIDPVSGKYFYDNLSTNTRSQSTTPPSAQQIADHNANNPDNLYGADGATIDSSTTTTTPFTSTNASDEDADVVPVMSSPPSSGAAAIQASSVPLNRSNDTIIPASDVLPNVISQSTPTGPISVNALNTNTSVSDLLNPNGVQPSGQSAISFNTVTQNTTQPTKLQSFSSNILDGYDNVTYHFRLSITPPNDALNVNSEPNGPFYIVAESGRTSSFYIKDVEIQGYVGANAMSKTTTATLVTIKIIEPQGCSFIDKLLLAAGQIHIQNIKQYPLILDLSFRGYNRSTGLEETVVIQKQSWRLVLNNMDTSMNEGGSEYTLYLAVQGDTGFYRLAPMNIIQQITEFPVTNVLSFFNDLANKVNEQLRISRDTEHNTPVVKIAFKIDSLMNNWTIGQSPDKKNAQSAFLNFTGQPTFKCPAGTTITDIVDAVLANTKEGQKVINPASPPDGTQTADPTTPTLPKIARVTCKVENPSFNSVLNEYDKNYTYYVTLQDNIRILIEKPTTQNDNRSQYLISSGALQKKYSYYFTGENQDILHWDLTLNALWINATTMYPDGYQRKNNTDSKFNQQAPPARGVNSERAILPSSTQFTPQPATPDAATGAYSTSTSAFSANSIPIANQSFASTPTLNLLSAAAVTSTTSAAGALNFSSAVANLQQTTNPIPSQNILASVVNQGIPGNVGLISQLNQPVIPGISPSVPVQACSASNFPASVPILSGAAAKLTTPNTPIITPQGQTLAQSNATQDILIETLGSPNTSTLLQLYSDGIDHSYGPNTTDRFFEATDALGRTSFGNIMNQVKAAGHDTDLLKINIEIRGDPFWLGESDVQIFNRLDAGGNAALSKINPQSANFLYGENSFFLTFKTPQNYDESTGFVNLQTADLFVGVYAVNTIVHSFSDGKFTQKIEAIRDIQTDPKQLAQFIQ